MKKKIISSFGDDWTVRPLDHQTFLALSGACDTASSASRSGLPVGGQSSELTFRDLGLKGGQGFAMRVLEVEDLSRWRYLNQRAVNLCLAWSCPSPVRTKMMIIHILHAKDL